MDKINQNPNSEYLGKTMFCRWKKFTGTVISTQLKYGTTTNIGSKVLYITLKNNNGNTFEFQSEELKFV